MPFIKKSELKRKDEKIKFFNKEIDILEKFKQYVFDCFYKTT
jgi:DNA-binding winged helix-turn-helix (wHTH) protein